ncbi:MAG: alanine racemase, partial [Thermoanaerobaculia bacterium]|nr:alanine racemase [Thermoanaerobaculia bacterium]
MDRETPIIRPTVARIDLSAFRDNLRSIRARLPESSRLIAVLKADGYGHGARPLAEVCQREDVAMLAVAILEEALSLRRYGIDLPILVLEDVPEDRIDLAMEQSITLAVPSPEALSAVSSWSRRNRREIGIHLQLDSGMNRMGLVDADLEEAIETLRESPEVRVDAIFSHYANASDPDDALNGVQRQRFERMSRSLREAGVEPAIRHFANSAATVSGQVSPGDWVRAGISLYGGEPLDAGDTRLRQVMQWTTRIARLKVVEMGEIVGYSGTWTAGRRSMIATLPVGYADGYDRLLSSNAEVLVRGKRAPVVGR